MAVVEVIFPSSPLGIISSSQPELSRKSHHPIVDRSPSLSLFLSHTDQPNLTRAQTNEPNQTNLWVIVLSPPNSKSVLENSSPRMAAAAHREKKKKNQRPKTKSRNRGEDEKPQSMQGEFPKRSERGMRGWSGSGACGDCEMMSSDAQAHIAGLAEENAEDSSFSSTR